MKTKTFILSSATLLAFTVLFSSCKKEGCTDPLASNYTVGATVDDGSCESAVPTPGTAGAPGSYAPSFSGVNGVLVAIQSVSTTSTPIGNIDSYIGTAVATFSEDGGATMVSAGDVDVNTNQLTAQANNSYVYTPSQADPTGISYASAVDWTGTGGTWPSFMASSNMGFSTVDVITSGDVSLNSGYTLSASSISNADSIYYGVYGPDGSAYHIVGAGSTSYTFTASELSGLGTGQGYVQVVGLKYDPQTIGGKDYWLINETVRTNSVELN
ncbi:MAG: hypothetical protein ACPGVI_04700 [Crocinitomicaceae bacterium]